MYFGYSSYGEHSISFHRLFHMIAARNRTSTTFMLILLSVKLNVSLFLSCSKKCKLKKIMFKRTSSSRKEMKFSVRRDDCIQTFCFAVMRYAIKIVRNANNSLIRTVKTADRTQSTRVNCEMKITQL